MRRISLALWLTLLPLTAGAQGTPAPSDPVAAELAQMHATLKQIVALLNRQSDVQELDLLMKRVQLGESQVTELERRLRSAESEMEGLQTEQSNLELRLNVTEAQLRRASPDVPSTELEAMTAQIQTELKRVRQRMGQVTQEISVLQSELGTRREDLRSWQAVLDRRLAKHAG